MKSENVIIEATQQYVFPVVLFTMLYKVILNFSTRIKWHGATI